MNILEATQQIEGAVRAYLSKDELGLYRIPPHMQRPLVLMGPPGLGKTAIVSQVAQKFDINYVSYSITHHTRQSALGLPYIHEEVFGKQTLRVSRYTMSEIIAACYDAIASSGVQEGILFLDEINCASETLAPALLQFLQYKTFGQHQLPEGWILICAGNPPEYNKAARDFDPAILDRLKRIDIEPNLDVWLDYALSHGVHPSILSYLETHPKNFYLVRAGISSMRIVTARGWEDLSRMIWAYMHEHLNVSYELIFQYLQDREIAEDFSLYFDLFNKYQDDYKIANILAGSVDEHIVQRASQAPFDERIALVNLLLDVLVEKAHSLHAAQTALSQIQDLLSELSNAQDYDDMVRNAQTQLDKLRSQGDASEETLAILANKACVLEHVRSLEAQARMKDDSEFNALSIIGAQQDQLVSQAQSAQLQINNALKFLAQCFSEGQELTLFITRLATDSSCMQLIAAHDASLFIHYSQNLMLSNRSTELLRQIEQLK